MRIVVFCAAYLPAYKSGGTVRAVEGIVSHLGREHDLYIFTQNRDAGAAEPLVGVEPGCWQRRGDAKVYFAAPRDVVPHRMAAIVSAVDPDGYYVNSFLSPMFGITPVLLRWAGAIPRRALILAPRGELQPAALSLGRFKKAAFVHLARRLPAYSDVLWQAGTEPEAEDIKHALGDNVQVVLARDLTSLGDVRLRPRLVKRPGELSVACLARITPIKNLVAALRMLGHVRGRVRYDIYGPIEKRAYYDECVRAASRMPSNVHVSFEGEMPHHEVVDVLASHHAFLLPTLGESFGHAILEALLAGCVLIISDQTPWRDLAGLGVGWDLPLKDEMAFVRALQTCVDMDDEAFAVASSKARQFGISAATSSRAIEENRALFRRLAVP